MINRLTKSDGKFMVFLMLMPFILGNGIMRGTGQEHDWNLKVTKDSTLACFNDRLLDKHRLFRKDSNIISASIDLQAYYFDTHTCSGICLYNKSAAYKNKYKTAPRYLFGKPYNVLIIIKNQKVLYLTKNIAENKKMLVSLKTCLPQMPDSLMNDSSLLNNHVLVKW